MAKVRAIFGLREEDGMDLSFGCKVPGSPGAPAVGALGAAQRQSAGSTLATAIFVHHGLMHDAGGLASSPLLSSLALAGCR